ncbi:UNVERIFIED_CONTAM: Exonuclease 1 [Sesamum latifolium]|uniref:Exonuclease 1 n=1 Tax=Sesamum latifolium TaxID=2727402 RepID=A0AAW2WMV4_9LAMI
MGIQGLLPLLKSIMNPIHIKELEGCFVAVDTYSWLHKGALSCSTELCKAQPTFKYSPPLVPRSLSMLVWIYQLACLCLFARVSVFLDSDVGQASLFSIGGNGFLLILIFGFLHFLEPCHFLFYGHCLYAIIRHIPCFLRHIDYCMHRVNMLRHYGVQPILVFDGGSLPMKGDQEIKRARSRRENLSRAEEHESNGNLSAAYECYQKAVDISPSVAYGLIQIIYKMDKFGQGVEFKNSKLQYNKELNLAGFTQMMLLEMCILSGCDYLPSLPGMGLKKAHALMKKFKSHENVIKHLKYNSVEHIAKGIAQGDLDPFTKMPIQMESGTVGEVLHGTYQSKNFKLDGERKRLDLPAQKNLLTNYFCFASLEAKRKFKAPRITPKHPNESNKTSSPCIDAQKVIHGKKTGDVLIMEAKDHGTCDDRGVAGYTEMNPFTIVQNSKRQEIVTLQSSSFWENIRESANCEIEKTLEQYSVQTHRLDLDAVDCTTTVDSRKNRARSSYFEEISVSENNEDPESGDLVIRGGFATQRHQSCNYSSCGSLSSDNPLECTMKKRKIAQTDSPTIQKDANDNNHMSGTSTSDLDEDMRVEEGKFGCNISHLGHYSNIAEKSMEKFVSVISSFRYNSSGSRASGLRAPLKDIKNNCIKRCRHSFDVFGTHAYKVLGGHLHR